MLQIRCAALVWRAGDGFYVVEEGEFTIYKSDASEEIAHAGPGSCFGERALLRSEPRAATVQAVTRWCPSRVGPPHCMHCPLIMIKGRVPTRSGQLWGCW